MDVSIKAGRYQDIKPCRYQEIKGLQKKKKDTKFASTSICSTGVSNDRYNRHLPPKTG